MENNRRPPGETIRHRSANGLAIRAYHTKARTGCKTCKIRRVRCDEQKPACQRCVTTGRECDGYATTPAFPPPKAMWSPVLIATADIPLCRTRKDPDELRSYRFFIDVTGPSVGEALNIEFWGDEIPRVSQDDDAIWHAVVSLGSAHESYVSGVPPKTDDNVFTLRHYNLAIQSLMRSYSAQSWWRALTLSTIFTSICCLEGRFEEARMHFKSGYNLLREFDTPDPPSPDGFPGSGTRKGSRPSLAPTPVSLPSLRSMLIAFEMREHKVDVRKVSELPTLLSRNDNFALWRSYAAPSPALAPREFLCAENLKDAIRNSESLFMSLLFCSMKHAKRLRQYYSQGRWDMLSSPGPSQEPHQRCFKELEQTLGIFHSELVARARKGGWRRGEAQLRQAFLSLRLIQTTNRFLLRRDPDEPDAKKRHSSLPALGASILDLAEQIMGLERKHGCIRSGGPIASPTIMNPVAIVAKCGFFQATRRRAVHLLLQPRLEGLWDTRMAGSYANAIMEREMAATKEYNQDPATEKIPIDDYTARGWDAGEDEPEEDIHPLARVLGTSLTLTGGRQAKLGLRTWGEWLEGTPGRDFWIYW